VLNTAPAFSPPLQFNLRARYDLAIADYRPFVTVGATHIGSMRNEPASFPPGDSVFCSPVPTTTLCLYTMPGYTTYDATIGVAKDNWTAQITGNNITNSDASTNISSGQFIKSEFPLRPRVLTLLLGTSFDSSARDCFRNPADTCAAQTGEVFRGAGRRAGPARRSPGPSRWVAVCGHCQTLSGSHFRCIEDARHPGAASPAFQSLHEERGHCFVVMKQAPPAIEAFLSAVNIITRCRPAGTCSKGSIA